MSLEQFQLQSRSPATTALARTAFQHFARLRSHLLERYQAALDATEDALSYQKQFSAIKDQLTLGELGEPQARVAIRSNRRQFYIKVKVGENEQEKLLKGVEETEMGQMLAAEERYWDAIVKERVDKMMSIESKTGLVERPLQQKQAAAQVPQGPPAEPVAWPNLVRVPVFGIDENTNNFQFEWPQPGDIEPAMLTRERVCQIKFLANAFDLRGIQVKLTNGFLSPIFDMVGQANPDQQNRTPRIISDDVGAEDIAKVQAAAYKLNERYMKRLTMLDADGGRVSEVSVDHGSGQWEVDVPPNLTLVGIYGNFGAQGHHTAIWGLGLLFFQREPEPEDPDLLALRLKIERLQNLSGAQ